MEEKNIQKKEIPSYLDDFIRKKIETPLIRLCNEIH
jgi:hypothetical protein